MKNISRRDAQRRIFFKNYEQKRLLLKTLADNQEILAEMRFWARLQLTKLPKNSSHSRIKNRCILSGRSRGTYARLRISRISLRKYASLGLITGLRKACW